MPRAVPWPGPAGLLVMLLPVLLAGMAGGLACGGAVVFESGSGSGGAGGGPGESPLCATQDPIGQLSGCSSGASGHQCATAECDEAGNTWEQTCEGTACVCSFNGNSLCVCQLNGEGDFCGSTPKCCPAPWR